MAVVWSKPGSSTTLLGCDTCGAAVAAKDTDTHNYFHAALADLFETSAKHDAWVEKIEQEIVAQIT